jgi:hypothetical protein
VLPADNPYSNNRGAVASGVRRTAQAHNIITVEHQREVGSLSLGVSIFLLVVWSSFAPYHRGGTVMGGDTVLEERHIHRDLP